MAYRLGTSAQRELARDFLGVAVFASLGSAHARATLDHAHHRSARRSPCGKRPLSASVASKLFRRYLRDRRLTAVFWHAIVCFALLRRECCDFGDTNPSGERRAFWIALRRTETLIP